MENIKNIIFDLGGVFIDIDYIKTEKAFVEAGIIHFNELYNQHRSSSLFEDLETGKIAPTDFYDALRQTSGAALTNEQIEYAWNAMLGAFLPNEIQWLEQIAKRYKIFLFSNTNQIHYSCFLRLLKQQTGITNFDDYFTKAYYSHILGLRKPYKASFEFILQEQQLLPQETLFIDDTLVNIEGAKQAGLQTLHLIPPQQVSSLGL